MLLEVAYMIISFGCLWRLMNAIENEDTHKVNVPMLIYRLIEFAALLIILL